MKLLSQKSREYNGKKYHKFWVILPNKIIERLRWKQGDELEAEIEKNKLTIEKED